MFRILTGELAPDSGELFISRKLRMAYMQQHAEYTSAQTVYGAALEVFSELRQMESALEKLQQQMEEGAEEGVIEKYSALHEKYMEQGGLTYEGRVRSTLLGLGFLPEELELPLSAVSGGQRTRVLLAKMLLEEPDMLLLDEPTNHLDLHAIEWLEEFLAAYRGTVLVISHDRFFIDRFVNRVFELEHRSITCYKGSYSDFPRSRPHGGWRKSGNTRSKPRKLSASKALSPSRKPSARSATISPFAASKRLLTASRKIL